MDRPSIDLSRPLLPFVLTPSPRDAATQMVAAFALVADRADRVGWVHGAVAAEIGPARTPADRALLAAGAAIAAFVDGDAVCHDRHPYHNRQHFCEVMLAAHFLCRWHEVPERMARLVLLAALVHDIDHDGTLGRRFASERRSVARSAPFLANAGVDASTGAALAALVLATEPREGVAFALAAHRGHLRGDIRGEPASSQDVVATELAPLLADADLARAATLLCEADVLPSSGLTPEHAMRLQDRLSEEWQCPLGPQDKARFLDEIIDAGVIGAFFLPNVRGLRESLRGATHAGAL